MKMDFKLPDIGEGVAEGEIVQWLVKAGDSVTEFQPIVEVMTDKATVEIPSPADGKVLSLHASPGETIPVGNVIFVLDSGEGGTDTHAGDQQIPVAHVTDSPEAIIDFKLPDVGEGVAEGEIVKWLVKAGQQVDEFEPVVEVMTDKATVEVPSPAPGIVTELLAVAGTTVPVGSVIFRLASSGVPLGAAAGTAAQKEAIRPAPPSAQPTPARKGGKVLAAPSARRVARELGVDLALVSGSGRNGMVRRTDVEAFKASGGGAAMTTAPSFAAAPVSGDRSENRTPFIGVRRKIATAMTHSKHTAAHFTVVEEVDATDLVRLRTEAKEVGARKGVKVTYMPFIMKATALALLDYPSLNGRLDEEAGELVNPNYVDLGIATDTPNGLIVPVIRDVQAKSIMELAAELNDLAERTRQGKVTAEGLKGSTFTITNAGNIGGIMATPIINFPDIAILGVHRLMKKPAVVERPDGDRIEIRQLMNFSVSVDHRLADGADGARFLVQIKKLLENPGLMAL